jgi:hypothetical protein
VIETRTGSGSTKRPLYLANRSDREETTRVWKSITAFKSDWDTKNESVTEGTCAEDGSIRSTGAVGVTSFTITNETRRPLTVNWLDYQGVRQKWFELQPRSLRGRNAWGERYV